MQCHRCGRPAESTRKPARSDLCAGCGSPLRACLNCGLHDPNAPRQCREEQAEFVGDKAAANFCEFFEPLSGRRAQAGNRAEDARKALDRLFSKGKKD